MKTCKWWTRDNGNGQCGNPLVKTLIFRNTNGTEWHRDEACLECAKRETQHKSEAFGYVEAVSIVGTNRFMRDTSLRADEVV